MLATRSLTGPQEGLDHFILLPDCVLAMDSGQLKRDLAGLQFNLHLLSDGPSGSVWLSGATPVDPKQNGRPSSAKQGIHWFAECASPSTNHKRRHHQPDGNAASASTSGLWFSDDLSLEGKEGTQVDREERLRILREKQNDERQRKLEELKQQALAAQKFREQKEEERRRRMEELRMRDTDRRHQVEERKRQIWEAERDRREAILRKNQEREARIESKRKNERSQIVFAFGSSTPRMLEPGETTSPYWATRRATSTTNVMTLSLSAAPGPLTRRSSERELDGSKKRATSAGGIERKPQHDPLRMTSSSVYEVFHWGLSPTTHERSFDQYDETDSQMSSSTWRKDAARRKTDLTPTLPASKDPGIRTPPYGKKSSPGRAYSMSRLDILASPRRPKLPQPHAPLSKGVEVYKSMSVLPGSDKTNKNSLKGAKSMLHLSPTPPPRATRAERLRKKAREMAQKSPEASGVRSGEMTPSRPASSMSQHSITSNLSSASASLRNRSAMTPRRPRPISIAVTGVTSDKSTDRIKSPGLGGTDKPPIPKVHSAKKSLKVDNPKKTEKPKSTKSSASTTPKATTPLQSPIVEIENSTVANTFTDELVKIEEVKNEVISDVKETIEELVETVKENEEAQNTDSQILIEEETKKTEPVEIQMEKTDKIDIENELAEADMTASMIAKVRITTEEAAKAALAERRRQAREKAEREAELERQRIEAERIAEEERLRKEEEEQKRMEEEQLRLLEEARQSEEIRLQQAIEEAKKREEEEKKRNEEELKLKIEKEEADKKAKEEAEKLRIEMEIRLKKEEEDRQARRKRVEAIMLRTRGKGSVTSNTATSKDGDDEDVSPPDEVKKSPEDVGSESNQFINSERSHTDANTTNNSQNNRHNGHHLNGSYNSVNQNNVTNTLLVNLGEERVGQILDLENGSGKLPDQPQFIPQFQEKKEPHTVNDLLS